MSKKILFVGLGFALLAAPFVSSALSISDLQAQITALLSQIQNVQLQATTTASANIATPNIPCFSFTRPLSIGSTGSDVTALQQFLSAQGLLNVSATGYFGVLTKAAVGNWQAQNDITTSSNAGFGMFGPLSRSFFAQRCAGTQSQSFSANPQAGAAPLTVTFTTSDSITASSTYSINFGDGASANMTKENCIAITAIVGGQGGIRCSYNVSHTYAANGTYTAQLMKNTCPAGAECFAGPLTVASTIVTVGPSSTNAVNFTASPTSGAAPLTVQFNSSAPQGTSIGSTVNFGDGTSGTLGVVPVCSSCNAEGIVSHTYANAGTYTATLTGGACACPANGICNCPNIPILGTATITVGSGTSNPNIQQLNAPGSVTLSQGGIAEIRNESFYFTLNSLTTSTATIQLTPVGCWNSFPSDTPPQIRCEIAVVPIPPQTLSIGQSYSSSNYAITLNQVANGTATFSVSASSSSGY